MSCSETVLSLARFNNNGGQRCSLDADYSWVVATTPPSAASMAKMCRSEACKQLIAAIKGAVPRECAYTAMGSSTSIQLYAQILDPIDATCNSAAQPTTTTPAPAPPATTPPTTPTVTVTTVTPTPTPSVTPDDSTDTKSNSLDVDGDSTPSSDGADGPTTPVPTTPIPTANSDSSNSALNGTTINGGNSTDSGGSSETIIAVSVAVVLAVAVIAFLIGRSRSSRRRSMTNASEATFAPVGGGHATNGTYIPQTGSTMRTSSQARPTPTTFNDKTPVSAHMGGGIASLWSDRAIQSARIPLDDIKLGQVLSAGAFGEVLLASYNGQRVAVKRLLPNRRKDMHEIEGFLEEAKLLATLRHPRVVRLVGVAWDSLTDLCVVTEFMNGGDLRSVLVGLSARNAPLGFTSDKVKIAVHVVHALSYLHGLKPSVVHRDLKSKNILLTDGLDAKLTDFGVSRHRAELTMTAGVGTSLWMAPEIMLGDRYDEKADMFSFGVVLSELDTHRLPYADATEPGTDRPLPEMAILQMVAIGTLSVSFTGQVDEEIAAIGRACTSVDPRDRPGASEVLRRLHHVWQSYGGMV